jgi:hypothetical protein
MGEREDNNQRPDHLHMDSEIVHGRVLRMRLRTESASRQQAIASTYAEERDRARRFGGRVESHQRAHVVDRREAEAAHHLKCEVSIIRPVTVLPYARAPSPPI